MSIEVLEKNEKGLQFQLKKIEYRTPLTKSDIHVKDSVLVESVAPLLHGVNLQRIRAEEERKQRERLLAQQKAARQTFSRD